MGLNGGGEGLSGDRVSGGVLMVIKREMRISRIIRGWRLINEEEVSLIEGAGLSEGWLSEGWAY